MAVSEAIPPKNVKTVVNTNQNAMKVFKVIVVGDSGVGKTSLTYRFTEGKYLESSEATIGVDFRERVINIDGEEIKLQLWDTAGQERFRKSMIQHYYRNAHAIVIVYDVTNYSSFHSLKGWIDECNKNNLYDIPRILVGNKCDEDAVVNMNTAQRFADQHGMPLFETSARLDSQHDNVEAIFMTLAHKLKSEKPFIPRSQNTITVVHGISNVEPQRSTCC